VPRTEEGPPAPDRTLLRGGAALAAATGAMSIFTYGYMIIASNVIGRESFGAFSALMGALLVINVLSLGLQATGARRISVALHETETIERMVLAVGARSAVLLGALCLLLAPLVDLALHLDSLPTTLLLGLAAVPLTYMGAQAGVLQGERRWGALSLVYLTLGAGRVVFGVALMAVWPTDFSAFAGVAAGCWLPVVVAHLALRRPRASRPSGVGAPVLNMLREVSHSSQALLAFFTLSNVDILLARATLSGSQAGLYAGGLIMTKAILFLPQFVVVLAFPSMAASRSTRYALVVGLGISLAFGGVGVVGVLLLPDLAELFVGGDDYAAIASNLWAFAGLGTILAMVQLLVYSTLARQQLRAALLTWAALVAVVAGGLMVQTATSLLLVVIVVDGVLLLAFLVTALGDSGAVVDTEPVVPG
jgi:O-antigen/teichoic acid export membrane protein